MDAQDWAAFAGALLVALAMPGPDLVLVVHSASRSVREGARTAAGIVTGLAMHAGLAAAGATALLVSAPGALTVVRLVGAGVLLWLGGSMLRAACGPPTANDVVHRMHGGFVRGLVTNATNPKALLFFAAILPSFIGAGDGAQWRTLVLCATVVLGAGVWWGAAIGVVRRIGVHRSATADRVITRLGAVALLVIGTGLLIGSIDSLLPPRS